MLAKHKVVGSTPITRSISFLTECTCQVRSLLRHTLTIWFNFKPVTDVSHSRNSLYYGVEEGVPPAVVLPEPPEPKGYILIEV